MTVDLPVEKPMTLARERFERIYKTIRDRICLLEYEPGARLGEEELARELGMSYSTLWRRIRESGRHYPRRLLSPREVEEIKSALGFSPPPRI